MSETSEQPPKKIDRRSFIKWAGKGAGAAAAAVALSKVVPKVLIEAGEVADKAVELGVQGRLTNAVNAGEFNFKDKPIRSGWDLNETIKKETSRLAGVNASALWVSDVDKNFQITTGSSHDRFIPGSIIKVPLLYSVWQRDQRDGTNNLTPEIASAILGRSETSRDFIMNLPYNQGKESSQTNEVLTQMLQSVGLEQAREAGGDIEISLEEYFRFLRHTDFPPVMLDAMLQTEEDDKQNYGISEVLRENYVGSGSIHFKIGMGETLEGHKFNSYVFMIGENVRAVGYTTGDNDSDLAQQMLMTAGALARYTS